MADRTCRTCGGSFNSSGALHCNPCIHKKRPRIPCSQCGSPTGWTTSQASRLTGEATCQPCRRSTFEHGTRKGYRERGCRCDECRAWARSGVAVYRQRVRESRPADLRRHPGECSNCGKFIIGTTLDNPVCAICRGNRPGYNIRVSPAVRRAIYERDGWTCQICLEPVDPDTPKNSTWDATLDHITPKSKGGSDDPENLRLAHRWCNSVRGSLDYYNDEDLRVS